MTEFNIGFSVPRKDKCDKWELERVTECPNQQQIKLPEAHKRSKLQCKEERVRDRNLNDNAIAVVCVDLQNVLILPAPNVKSIFYLRKLYIT